MAYWTVFFDYEHGVITVTRADDLNRINWTFAKVDETVSDPDGKFVVYINPEDGTDVAFRITMRRGTNYPAVVHASFDASRILSSPTLWVDGQSASILETPSGLSLSHIWMSSVDIPWVDERPTAWEAAADHWF